MYHFITFICLLLLFTIASAGPDAVPDTSRHEVWLPPVTVESGRVDQKSPVTFTNLDTEEIQRRNTASDLPLVLNTVPGLSSYSEAGSSLGYSYLRLRGFDQSKVAVMINGMPLNDPESHMVYWVDLPDIASGAEDIQVQRGAGNGGLGISPFGGAVNLVTLRNGDPGIQFDLGYGSWNTRKASLQFTSGLVDKQWQFSGRYSKLDGEGYRDASWTKLWSAYLSAVKIYPEGSERFNIILGNEKLHLAYNGVAADCLSTNPKFNSLKAPIDQTDNFFQPHFQWLVDRRYDANLTYDHTLYLSGGKGSYVQWKPNKALSFYGMGPYTVKSSTGADSTVTNADLVVEKWVAMRQVGWLPKLTWKRPWGELTGELEMRSNIASHWGVVNWASNSAPGTNPQPEYYRWNSIKEYYGMAFGGNWQASDKMLVSGALTMRHIEYIIHQQIGGNPTLFPGYNTKADWTFFLPRLGLVYDYGEAGLARFSIARSAHEPAQSQLFEPSDGVAPMFADSHGKSYENPFAKPEELTAFELGFRHYHTDKFFIDISTYYNLFQNEIIPVGGMNSLGEPIMGNAKSSYQFGIEADAGMKLPYNLSLRGNVAFEQAKFLDYTIYDQTVDSNWASTGSVKTKLDGETIPNIPTLLGSGTLSYRAYGIDAWWTTRYSGDVPLNYRGVSSLKVPPYAVSSVGVWYSPPDFVVGEKYTFDVRVENLFDRKYASNGYFYEYATPTGIETVNEFYPGAPRNYWFGVSVKM